MVVCYRTSCPMRSSTWVMVLFVINCINTTRGLNLGLFAGDNKKHIKPLLIKKYTKHSPVFINIHPSLPKLSSLPPLPTLPSVILPTKPPPTLSALKTTAALRKLKSALPLTSRLPKITSPRLLSPLLIPKLPVLPILPPLLPIIPPLPLLPVIPKIPRLSKITKLLRPLRIPILGKTPLQRALGSELMPVTVSSTSDLSKKSHILKKLLDLKRKGSLTTAEFIRFKKLLLK